MALSANEQFMLELINRTRLDPLGEVTRNGIALNTGLGANELGSEVRQVLAPNALLEKTAIGHSQWMLAADIFSHTGANNSSPGDRATAENYNWSRIGENIAWQGTTGSANMAAMIEQEHNALVVSPHHRINLLFGGYREIGLSQEGGGFSYSGNTYNSSMVTQNFGLSGTKVFLTGVAYTDSDANKFYSIGEGKSGVSIKAQALSTTSAAAGGYALALTAGSAVAVSGKVDTTAFTATVSMAAGNVKLDVVDGSTFYTSGDIHLGTGINHVRLLGTGSLDAFGNDNYNRLSGNNAANELRGYGGADKLSGLAGNDYMVGGTGNDSLWGDGGSDKMWGGSGADSLFGGSGADRLDAGTGNDMICGGADQDAFTFVHHFGKDTISDFSVAAHDSLRFDDALWGGKSLTEQQVVSQFAKVVAGGVTFTFAADAVLHLDGVTTTAGLAALIDFY